MSGPPNSGSLRGRRSMVRALFAVLVLVGVVAMHGLTMDHEAAMVGMTSIGHDAVSAGSSSTALHHPGRAQAAIVDAVMDLPAPLTAASASLTDLVLTTSPVGRTMAGMPTVCVAFLTALLLLLSAARLLLKVRRLSAALRGRAGVAWFATAVAHLRPDLAELSVLRT